MLTKRQKEILHRAIDSALDQGSAKYVDDFGLPVDVVAHVAIYSGVPSGYIEAWDGPVNLIDCPLLEPYMSEDTHIVSAEYDNRVVGYYRPAAQGPILVVLQKLWDMARLPRNDNQGEFIQYLREYMHALVDTI